MIFIDSGLFSQYFAYKRYFNTIIGPWDLSRIVDNGLIYILTEYNVFWTDPARAGPARAGPGRKMAPRMGVFAGGADPAGPPPGPTRVFVKKPVGSTRVEPTGRSGPPI